MKISIITVCKNAESSIEKTLLGLYSQTYKNIEHIVIDGVSTDKTLEILENYKDKISVLVSEPDTGIYNAMNKALKLVTGDIVYFLNATDTLYDENVLRKVVQEFEKHPDLEFLWGDIQFVEDNKDIRIATFEDIKVKSDLIYRNPCHQCIFYKNELFTKNGGYNEEITLYADYDLNVRMLVKHNSRCKYMPEILARFELGGFSTTLDEKTILMQKRDRKEVYNQHFRKNINFILDNFFTKIFGTITRKIKKSLLWKKFFKLYDKTLQLSFNKRLSLNLIENK